MSGRLQSVLKTNGQATRISNLQARAMGLHHRNRRSQNLEISSLISPQPSRSRPSPLPDSTELLRQFKKLILTRPNAARVIGAVIGSLLQTPPGNSPFVN